MRKRLLSYIAVALATMVFTSIYNPLNAFRGLAQGGCQTFPETGKQVCGRFLEYWQRNGGLAQQGLPLTNEFQEISELNGQTYTVQYFERAVFEKHPENAAPFDVLLSQLGTFQLKRKYPGGDPSAGQQPAPQPTQQPRSQPTPTTAPTNSKAGMDVTLLERRTYQRKYSSYITLVGIMQNTGSVELGSVKLVVTLKDAAGKIVGTKSDFSPSGIRPGELWDVSFLIEESLGVANYTFDAEMREMTSYDRQSVYREYQVNDLNTIPPGQYDSGVSVTGTILNTGTATSGSAEVVVIGYDGAGKMVDAESTYADLSTIAPGQSSPFEVELAGAPEVANVKVFAYGRKK